VWKKTRPVEDPWAPPADFARVHYPAAASSDNDSTEVSDAVAGAEAGDVASSLGADSPSEAEGTEENENAPEEKRGTHRGDS
jgi:hypothetical protein